MPLTRIDDFQVGQHHGTSAMLGGGLAAAAGEWLSPEFRGAGPLNWAVAAWNARAGRVEVQIRVATPGGWSPWFSFGSWSPSGERRSIRDQVVPGVGKLDTDTLLLERPVQVWQVKVRLSEGATVARLFIATALREHRSPDDPRRAAWGCEIDVPAYSQMIYPNGGNVWCSPTSLAMVMAHYGTTHSIPDQVAPGVYDSVYRGTGNWPFNTAYAGAHGFAAWVDRFPGFAELEDCIIARTPVIASVSYSDEWLENAPIGQTGGHLLVVRGFTAAGDVIVNDPAAPQNETVRRVYKREQFRRAWLDRGGVVYMVRPE